MLRIAIILNRGPNIAILLNCQIFANSPPSNQDDKGGSGGAAGHLISPTDPDLECHQADVGKGTAGTAHVYVSSLIPRLTKEEDIEA